MICALAPAIFYPTFALLLLMRQASRPNLNPMLAAQPKQSQQARLLQENFKMPHCPTNGLCFGFSSPKMLKKMEDETNFDFW
jgi:hypothetical protein